jgi:hypothetical protein
MALGISTTVLTMDPPASTSVVLTDVPLGQEFTVLGNYNNETWPVPGGVGVGTGVGTQIVLSDNRTALNVPFYYTMTTGGTTYTSNSVTVSNPTDYVLQALDRTVIVPFIWQDNGLPRTPTIRTRVYDVPGNPRPPSRYAPAGLGSITIIGTTDVNNSRLIRQLFDRPIVVRTSGCVGDFPAVELVTIVAAPSELRGDGEGATTMRTWQFECIFTGDPEPGVVAVAFDFDDFDTIYTGVGFTAFDAAWAGQGFDAFDRYDWGQLL